MSVCCRNISALFQRLSCFLYFPLENPYWFGMTNTRTDRMDFLPPKQELQPVLPPVPVQNSGVEVNPQFLHLELSIEAYLKITHNLKLDTDAQICSDHLSPSGCPLGTSCPLRHTTPSSRNFRPPSPIPYSAHARTVCKHWLRGLCKKGQACEFLHEYNLRKMPECWFFTRYGYCQSGDECMYLHITPKERRPECWAFTKGFCPKGLSFSHSFPSFLKFTIRV